MADLIGHEAGNGGYSQGTTCGAACPSSTRPISGSVSTTKQFIWETLDRSEERDGSGGLVKAFQRRGYKEGTSKFFYSKDHLGSTRELTDNSATTQFQASYSPYGQVQSSTGPETDFEYTQHYVHSRSGLYLTANRSLNTTLGRWTSREPLELYQVNSYCYVENQPISLLDPSGMQSASFRGDISGVSYNPNRGSQYWPGEVPDKPMPECPFDCWNYPMPSEGPGSPCGFYGTETFGGISERCFCRCMKDSGWAQRARGCLWCERAYNGNTNDFSRHMNCIAGHANPYGLWLAAGCTAQCAANGSAY